MRQRNKKQTGGINERKSLLYAAFSLRFDIPVAKKCAKAAALLKLENEKPRVDKHSHRG